MKKVGHCQKDIVTLLAEVPQQLPGSCTVIKSLIGYRPAHMHSV